MVKTWADCEELQEDLREWQMRFCVHKYKVTYIEAQNPNFTYTLVGSDLEVTNWERELGGHGG